MLLLLKNYKHFFAVFSCVILFYAQNISDCLNVYAIILSLSIYYVTVSISLVNLRYASKE